GCRNEPVDGGTLDSLGFLTKLFENLVEACDLIFGLFEMVAQAFRELAIGRLIDQRGQRLHDLALGVVHVLETMQKQVIHRFNVLRKQAHEAAPLLSEVMHDGFGSSCWKANVHKSASVPGC